MATLRTSPSPCDCPMGPCPAPSPVLTDVFQAGPGFCLLAPAAVFGDADRVDGDESPRALPQHPPLAGGDLRRTTFRGFPAPCARPCASRRHACGKVGQTVRPFCSPPFVLAPSPMTLIPGLSSNGCRGLSEPRQGMLPFTVLRACDSVLKSGTAQVRPIISSRLATNPVVCRSVLLRQVWRALLHHETAILWLLSRGRRLWSRTKDGESCRVHGPGSGDAASCFGIIWPQSWFRRSPSPDGRSLRRPSLTIARRGGDHHGPFRLMSPDWSLRHRSISGSHIRQSFRPLVGGQAAGRLPESCQSSATFPSSPEPARRIPAESAKHPVISASAAAARSRIAVRASKDQVR